MVTNTQKVSFREKCPQCAKSALYCFCGSFSPAEGLINEMRVYRKWRNKEKNNGHEVPRVG